jgi:hypothetical protein
LSVSWTDDPAASGGRACPGLCWLALLSCLAATPVVAQSVDSTRVFAPRKPWVAVAEVLGINVAVNRFDAWVLNQDWAKVTPEDWANNLKLGWEWDENAFGTNMFSHPYHGSLYFNAARSNGLTYWEAIPLTFLGSWTWEYFGEKYRPSLNDFFMTSFGGVTLGEVFHRVGATIRDNQATGSSRFWREMAALPFDPIGGINRLIRGEWKAVGANPEEHGSGRYVFRVHGGIRFTGEEGLDDSSKVSGMVLADLQEGDPYETPYTTPFDVFFVRGQVSGDGGLNMLRASGRLYGKDLRDSTHRSRHVFAINGRYDYDKNRAYSYGAQSFEGGLHSRWRLPKAYRIRTHLFASAIPLGAIDGQQTGVGERTYDFGPGVGLRFDLGLERRGITYISILGRTEYLHSVSGAEADHTVDFGGFELTVPIRRGFGLGLHTGYFNRTSRYADGTRENRKFTEGRLFVSYTSARRPATPPPSTGGAR